MTARRITYLALFTAAALVLHLLESSLPPLFAFAPGAKMGLANVVTLIAVFFLGWTDAIVVLVVRCLLGALFGGGVWSLAYSLPAGIIALFIEVLLIRTVFPRLTLISISFVGALAHNAMQLMVASLTVRVSLMAVLPAFLFASLVAGLFVGTAAYLTLRCIPERAYIVPAGRSRAASMRAAAKSGKNVSSVDLTAVSDKPATTNKATLPVKAINESTAPTAADTKSTATSNLNQTKSTVTSNSNPTPSDKDKNE